MKKDEFHDKKGRLRRLPFWTLLKWKLIKISFVMLKLLCAIEILNGLVILAHLGQLPLWLVEFAVGTLVVLPILGLIVAYYDFKFAVLQYIIFITLFVILVLVYNDYQECEKGGCSFKDKVNRLRMLVILSFIVVILVCMAIFMTFYLLWFREIADWKCMLKLTRRTTKEGNKMLESYVQEEKKDEEENRKFLESKTKRIRMESSRELVNVVGK